jgi:hypothetical protein
MDTLSYEAIRDYGEVTMADPFDWHGAMDEVQDEIADLQRQLREAQEGRDLWRGLARMAHPHLMDEEDAVAELDAAIVRGKLLWDGLGKELAAHLAGFYTPIMLDLVTQKNAAIVRAEAAEALAERLQGRIGTNTTQDIIDALRAQLREAQAAFLAATQAARAQRDDNLEHLGRRCAKLEAERAAAIKRAEAAEALIKEIAEKGAGALECAACDLEALDAGVEVTERGEEAPWHLARLAGDRLIEMASPAEAQKEGDDD